MNILLRILRVSQGSRNGKYRPISPGTSLHHLALQALKCLERFWLLFQMLRVAESDGGKTRVEVGEYIDLGVSLHSLLDLNRRLDDISEIVGLVQVDAVLRWDQRVGLEVETSDDAEVCTAAFESTVEVGVLVCVCVDDLPI